MCPPAMGSSNLCYLVPSPGGALQEFRRLGTKQAFRNPARLPSEQRSAFGPSVH
jgi:hypothetical protein